MVAVVTGPGLGLERSSAMVLGSAGQLGSSPLGRGGDNVSVNASDGNLVIQNTDEMLIGLGLSGNDVLSRTYNSQGTFTANGWQESTQRQVSGLTGTVNTAGSTINHIAWDGSVVTYAYNATLGAYVAKEGSGPADTLTFSGTTWTWRDGASQTTETYDSANGGRITSRADLDGNTLAFTYTSGLLTKVTTQDGEFTTLSYSGSNLTQITTTLSGGATLTRVRYGYDSSNRLTSVTVDKSPGDNTITDGATYVTTYGYDGTSNRVASITQSDGSSLQIAYVSSGSPAVYKVLSLTQALGGGLAPRVTSFSYGAGSPPQTTVTDPLGLQTVLTYDSQGQLTKITAPPAVTGATAQTYQFTYDTQGNVLTSVAPSGLTTTYGYDANGNQTSATGPAGDVITRTYGSANQLLSQTVSPATGVSLTTRYAYDAHNHLRYVIGAQGDVSEYRYNSSGQQISAIRYTANTYTTAGTPTEATLNSWVSGISDLSTTQRTDTTYDFRGNVFTVKSYSKVLSSGVGDTTATVSTTTYLYDQAGNLLSRQPAGSSATETFVYDGLFRQTLATDLSGASTSVAFDDTNAKTVVTLANGTTQTSTYDLAGDLIASAVSGSGVTTATSTEKYDADGRLRMVTDPTTVKTYFLYDNAGRKVADIAANGSIVEYRYNSDNQLIETIQYKRLLTSTQLASLVDSSGNPASVTVASLLPAADAGDRWTWSVHDAAGRVIETIDATGAVTVLSYDTASRLTSTTSYANFLSATVVAGFKTTAPTALTLPTADATHDNVTRDFYDSDGRLVAVLDADGHLSQIVYDAAGEKTQTLRSANAAASNLWVTGTLAQLIASAATSSHDETTSYVYDAEGELRFTIDANGRACEYVYDAAGNLLHTTEYANAITTASSYSLAYVQSHLSAAGADRTTRNVYDAANRLAFSINAEGDVVAYSYDTLSHVVKQVAYATIYTSSGDPSLATMQSFAATNAGNGANRVARSLYDADGRAVYAVDAEGYVTESQYDLAGRVTKQIRYAAVYTVTDATTMAQLAAAIGTLPADAAVTGFTYDAAGRLTDVTDPMGFVTHSVLDALGQVTDSTVAWGTGDAQTTHFDYDAAGRVSTQTGAYGTAEATSTGYTYDGAGRVTTTKDGRSTVTTRTYDAVGQLMSVSTPLDGSTTAVTSYQYDSFGNRTVVTDPRGNIGYFYYDNLNRLTLQVDPEGYVTATTYSRGDQAISVTHYANRATGSYSASVLPTYAATSSDETTLIGRDKLDRVTSTTDAMGYTESYTLDAFGNRISVTNKLGGTSAYAYDRRGLLTRETMSVASDTSAGVFEGVVFNTYSYDARGNKTQMVEAAGLADTRTTNYAYDKNDRLIGKTANDGTNETTKYDARGDIVETDDSVSARTLYYYDHLGRKTASLDATGAMTTWTYDPNGNVASQTQYSMLVALPVTPGGAPPSPPSGVLRQTFYTYDLGNRLISTRTPAVTSGFYNGAHYQIGTSDVIVQTIYDKSGNVIQQIDANGGSIYSFYDKLGHKVAQVDQNNFLTSYLLDSDGNVLSESRWATAIVGAVSSLSDPVALRINVAKTTDDRVTLFSYDRNGRRLTETRLNTNGLGGPLINPGQNATITYTYNGLGEVLTKQEATGETTTYAYDVEGRQTAVTGGTFTDGPPVTPQTETFYDGLNNVVRTRVGATTHDAAADHITTFAYTAGRLTSTTNAAGATTSFQNDADGRVTDQAIDRTVNGTTTKKHDENVTHYNALGQVIYQQTVEDGVGGDYTTMGYDAFGDLTARGINGLTQEKFVYDNAGRLFGTTANGGVISLFIYDAAGNKTFEIDSAGDDLSNVGAFAATNMTDAGVATTYFTVDARGQTTHTIQKSRQISLTDTEDLTTSNVYNAFGEIAEQTDARGGVTDFVYNTMGKVTQQIGPAVGVTDASGVTQTIRTVTKYGYDNSGRLHTVLSAEGTFEDGNLADINNPFITNRRYIVGTGYDGSDPITLATYLPYGVIANSVDVFGNIRSVTNQLNQTETRVYDKMNNLIEVDHAMRSDGTQLKDYYQYDELGHQIAHWNSELGSSAKATTDYDAQGRVIKQVDFAGHFTTTAYTWDSSLQTAGLTTYGGWHKVTTLDDGVRATYQDVDYFGRTVGMIDQGGHHFFMTFDLAGRLVHQTMDSAAIPNRPIPAHHQDTVYTYFNTGKVATVADGAASEKTIYAYDKNGNQTDENLYGLSDVYDPAHSAGAGAFSGLQLSHATYDAQNRMVSLTNTNDVGAPGATIGYKYDANGNIRNIHSTYTDAVSGSQATEDDWYTYDFEDRVVISKGTLFTNTVNGVTTSSIAPGGDGTGVRMTYDAAGERTSATTSHFGQDTTTGVLWDQQHTEFYTYTADGYLATVSMADATFNTSTRVITSPTIQMATLRASDERDAMGRVTKHTEYAAGVQGYTVFSPGYHVDPTGHYEYSPGYHVDGTGHMEDQGYWVDPCDTTWQSNWVWVQDTPGYDVPGYYYYVQDTAGYDVADSSTVYGPTTGAAVYLKTATYDADSNELNEVSATLQADGFTVAVSRTDFNYRGLDQLAEYVGGVVVSTHTTSGSIGSSTAHSNVIDAMAQWTGANAGSIPQSTTDTHTDFEFWNAAIQSQIHTVVSQPGLTTTAADTFFTYDGDGHLTLATVFGSRPRTITYVNNALGELVSRTDSTGPKSFALNFAGIQRGNVGNDGRSVSDMDYAAAITARQRLVQTTPFQNGTSPTSFANFDTNATPINGSTDLSAPGDYTVRDGDTLQSIAQAVWGDANLWYLIADANGLSSGSALPAGMSLSLPNKVINLHNTDEAYRVYDPNKAIGDVDPNAPTPIPQPSKKKKHWYDVFVKFFDAAINFVVSSFFGAVAGNVAMQAFMLVTRQEKSFNWKSLATDVITAGITAGVNASGAFDSIANAGLRAAATQVTANVLTQGVELATGLQSKFDWTSVAAAGVGAYAGGSASNWAAGQGLSDFGVKALTGTAALVANSATRSLINGSDFGDNILAALPDVLAQTFGGTIASVFRNQDGGSIAGDIAHDLHILGQAASNAFGGGQAWQPMEVQSIPTLDVVPTPVIDVNNFIPLPTFYASSSNTGAASNVPDWLRAAGAAQMTPPTMGTGLPPAAGQSVLDAWAIANKYHPDQTGFLSVVNSNPAYAIAVGTDGLGDSALYFHNLNTGNTAEPISLETIERAVEGGRPIEGVPEGVSVSSTVFYKQSGDGDYLDKAFSDAAERFVHGISVSDSFSHNGVTGQLTLTARGSLYFQPGVTTGNTPDTSVGYTFDGNADEAAKGVSLSVSRNFFGFDFDSNGKLAGIHSTLGAERGGSLTNGSYIGSIFDTRLGAVLNPSAYRALHDRSTAPGHQ